MAPSAVLRAPLFALLVGPVGALAGCGAAEDQGPAGPAAAPASFSGTYDVTGITTEQPGGTRRRIAGRVVVTETPGAYGATFSLETEFATPEGPVQADLIGTGEGGLEGDRLVGSAETQMILGGVPGIDPKFPWIPGRLGARVVSSFAMWADRDGTFVIEISTKAAGGQQYAPTVTSMRAVAVDPKIVAEHERARKPLPSGASPESAEAP